MFGELTLVNCLVSKSLANGCQPKKLLHDHHFVFMCYDKIINLCALAMCFYAVDVSNDELSEQ